MNRVYSYVMKNFREKISLRDVASIANMSPSAFSRYFKVHANKTFSNFLSEIRIGYSCKLLIQQKTDIAQICYDSGFNTLSNFNRQFKNITHYNPFEYRKKYSELAANFIQFIRLLSIISMSSFPARRLYCESLCRINATVCFYRLCIATNSIQENCLPAISIRQFPSAKRSERKIKINCA